jgi:hypothetical protein
MTLITMCNSDGCVGRCDAGCHDATSSDCDCICGGRNHGAGLQRAMENTRELFQGWIKEYELQHQLTDAQWSIPAIEPQQPNLF